MVEVFREVKRVLRDDGTLWLNLGDSYASTNMRHNTNDSTQKLNNRSAKLDSTQRPNTYNEVPDGLKVKDLCGIPWRVAFALQYPDYTCNGCGETHHSSEWGKFPNGRLICPSCELSKGHSIIPGWYLRSDIIWSKPNPMPESVTDRPTKAHEYIFLLTKQARYYYDADAVREKYLDSSIERLKQGFNMNGLNPAALATKNPAVKAQGIIEPNPAGRNRRTVWEIATQPTPEAHFATFPEALVEPCIKAGTSERGCCPVCGSPWERKTETEYKHHEKWFGNKQDARHSRGDAGTSYDEPIGTKTLGWQPTCTCNNPDTLPCTVLDPFGGSGTTGLVARNLKRDAVLIELNPKYVKIMKKKLRLNEQLTGVS